MKVNGSLDDQTHQSVLQPNRIADLSRKRFVTKYLEIRRVLKNLFSLCHKEYQATQQPQ